MAEAELVDNAAAMAVLKHLRTYNILRSGQLVPRHTTLEFKKHPPADILPDIADYDFDDVVAAVDLQRRLTYDSLQRALAQFNPRVNYLTVCGDWLNRCFLSLTSRPREQFEHWLRNVNGRTLLQEAVAQGKIAVVELLLRGRKYRRILFEKDEHGWQAVHHAAFYGGTEALTMLQAKGADINAVVDSSKYTPLMLAALMGNATTVQRLLQLGANPARRDHLGMDALQLAVLGMYTETVEVLLQHGLTEETIVAARKLAVERNSTRHGYSELLALLDSAARRIPVALNEQGLTELQRAAFDVDMTRVEAILERDRALIHEPDRHGLTVAHHAALIGYLKLMQLLYSTGADFKATSPSGYNPALLAARSGNLAALAFLIKIDADFGVSTTDGNNILHLAVENGHADLVSWLVHKGANLRLRNQAGESALDIAKRLGNNKLIGILDRVDIRIGKDGISIGAADRD